MPTSQSAPAFKFGDRVQLKAPGKPTARIVELRGPQGPGGAQIYRVRIKQWPKAIYVEVREDQLKALPPKE